MLPKSLPKTDSTETFSYIAFCFVATSGGYKSGNNTSTEILLPDNH
jgi:hypothetical protein